VRTYAVTLGALALASLALVAVGRQTWTADGRLGADAVPLLGVMPAVIAASIAGVIAAGARMRQAIGSILVVLAVVTTVSISSGPSLSWWPWPAVALIVLMGVLIVGAVVIRSGRAWPVLGSRYARQERSDGGAGADPQADESPQEQWKALDEGRDPTL
jgi:hypothetical protein